MNKLSTTIKRGTDGNISIPLLLPDPLAHSGSPWTVFSALLIGAVEDAVKNDERVSELLQKHGVTIPKGRRASVSNEALR